jgi:hypothetical protein
LNQTQQRSFAQVVDFGAAILKNCHFFVELIYDTNKPVIESGEQRLKFLF